MQIIFDENEIMEALDAYISKKVETPVGKQMKVDFIMGRAPAGPRAEVQFVEPEDADVKEVKKIMETAAKEPIPKETAPEEKKAEEKKPAPKPTPEKTKEPEEETEPETEEKSVTEEPKTEQIGGVPTGASLFQF